MPSSNIKIHTFTGSALTPYLPSLARLRIEVFRDYPYLYEGDMDYETRYLKKYIQTPDSIGVIVFDESKIVGASTGLPLECEVDEVKKPFKENHLNIHDFFYFGESVLLKEYRGRGIGHHFFDMREAHAKQLKRFRYICFCSVKRPNDHPKKPADYFPLNDFWQKRGYVEHPELTCYLSWKDLDDHKETEKPMVFWIKELPSHV